MKLKHVSVRFPKEACAALLANGDPNPFWDDIVLTRVFGIDAPERDGDDLVFTGITDLEQLTIAKLQQVLVGVPQVFGKPAEVYNYPCWIKLPEGAHEQEVPDVLNPSPVIVTPAIPEGTVDEEGNPVEPQEAVTRPRTWADFRMAREVEGVWYAPCTDGGDYYEGTKILALVQAVPGSEIVLAPPAVETPE